MFRSCLEIYPARFVFLGSIVLFSVATEVGFRIGRYMRENREHIESGSTGLVTGSILGLVSFLLAFTFGMAASNYSERRGVVLDEANAIGTAYLRADLMGDDAQAARFRQLLFDYARTRMLGDESGMNVSDFVAVIRRSEAIQSQIWDMAAAEMRANPTPATAVIVTAVNEVIDLHAVRLAVGMRLAGQPA